MIGAAFGETLLRAQAGDESAFTFIFRDVQPMLLRYLKVIAPEPEDVAGDTWMQVVAALPGFHGGEKEFRSWLFTIARHRAVDAGRSRHRRPEVPIDLTEAPEQPTITDAADLALDTISAQQVVAMIASLPRDQAEIIMLRVVADLEANEVARIVRKSPGAVRVAAHRGLRRLADKVERTGVTR